ncbi:MerR family DNA-binding transcriptional regulator, partial [Micromonospora sp. STR1_7]|nr:MerR family DNA-binding transcriptional regulator [Micromonospora parastrephiae]
MDVEPKDRLRAVDLAATVGISVQQVRNYVEQGVLPPVRRTPSGYRIFTTEHSRALTVARRLAEGHGWGRTREIMAAVHRGDLPAALAALDGGHAELDRERADIRRVLGAFETVLAPSRRPGRHRAGASASARSPPWSGSGPPSCGSGRPVACCARPARRAPTTGCTTKPSCAPRRSSRCCAEARTRSRSSRRCWASCVPPAAPSGSAPSWPAVNRTCTRAACAGCGGAPRCTTTCTSEPIRSRPAILLTRVGLMRAALLAVTTSAVLLAPAPVTAAPGAPGTVRCPRGAGARD